MTHETLLRLRAGLSDGRVSLRALAEQSGIPKSTLSDMAQPGWQQKTIERLADLQAALDALEIPSLPQGKSAVARRKPKSGTRGGKSAPAREGSAA